MNSADESDSDRYDEITELETVTRDEKWGGEAFRDAGGATFGDG